MPQFFFSIFKTLHFSGQRCWSSVIAKHNLTKPIRFKMKMHVLSSDLTSELQAPIQVVYRHPIQKLNIASLSYIFPHFSVVFFRNVTKWITKWIKMSAGTSFLSSLENHQLV